MYANLIQQWKTLFVSIATVAASFSQTLPAVQFGNPSAPNVGISSGTSRNWAGYDATNGSYTSVSGTWTIPNATGSGHTSADAEWVGIGGIANQDLIQSGT